MRVLAAPARHLCNRRHHRRRADLWLPRLALCLPTRSAARPASRRGARWCRGNRRRLQLPDPLHRARAHPGRPRWSGATVCRRSTIDLRAVGLVRDYLAAHAREQTPASILEEIAGIDRFTIARHFRWAFGTSPDRYRTLRRLALAQAAIASGQSLAQVAAEVGFADQSHMTRQFKRTYGLTPARWMTLTAASSPERPATRGQRRHLHTLRPGTKKVEEC